MPFLFIFFPVQITYQTNSDDIRAADESHRGTYKAQHSTKTSAKDKIQRLQKFLKISTVKHLKASYYSPVPLLGVLHPAFFYRKRTEKKKKYKKNNKTKNKTKTKVDRLTASTTADDEELFSVWW